MHLNWVEEKKKPKSHKKKEKRKEEKEKDNTWEKATKLKSDRTEIKKAYNK